MAAKTKIDSYANVAALKVTESAANTQTSTKFAFPFSIMDKMGILMHRIEYEVTNGANLAASVDRVTMALTTAASVTDITDVTDPQIIDSVRFTRYDFGAAASGILLRQPFVKDFSSLPGGGVLMAPNPLYMMVEGFSVAAAFIVQVRLYYTYMNMTTEEYWQLVESRRIISS